MPQQHGGGPGGPGKHPPPHRSPVFRLDVPDIVLETVSEDQLARIATVELAFAQSVSSLLAKAYAEILTIAADRKTETLA